MSACRSCGARVLWARTLTTGKAIPLNPEPKAGGNLQLKDGVARYVQPSRTIKFYVSHFVDCPNANGHRTSRARR